MEYKHKTPDKLTEQKCLFKLSIGSKYLIFKTLDLKPFLARLSMQLSREIAVLDEKSVFVNLVKEIVRTKCGVLEVEILGNYKESLDLLIDEYGALKEASKDKNCLNTSFANYNHYPKWVDQTSINNFKEYYTKGKNTGTSVKDKKFRRFIRDISQKDMYLDDFVNKVCAYVKKNYK